VAESHGETISLVVSNSGSVWAVNGELLIVGTETVSVSIGVREETTLKHLVQGRLNTWNQVAGSESRLLSLSVVVLGVAVENQFTNLLERIITMGPDLSDVVNIESVVIGISNWHNLNVPGPGRGATLSDVVIEIPGSPVLVLNTLGDGLLIGEVLDTRVGLEVVFDEESLTGLVHPLESVGTVAVHVSVTIGGTTVGEEDGDLVEGLRRVAPEVEGHVTVLAVVTGVSLLGMDEIRELNRILNEENRGVVTNHVVVTILSIELDGKTSGISVAIVGTTLTGNSGEAGENGSSLANVLKEFGLGELRNIMSKFKVTMGTSTLGVDNSLRNTLSVEVSELVNKVEVLEEERTSGSSGHGVLVVIDGSTVGGGKLFALHS